MKRKTYFYASDVKMFIATRPTRLKRCGPVTEWSRDANSVNKRNIELNENIRSVSISKSCGLYIKVGNLTKRTSPETPLQLEPTLRRSKRTAAQWTAGQRTSATRSTAQRIRRDGFVKRNRQNGKTPYQRMRDRLNTDTTTPERKQHYHRVYRYYTIHS